jgi:hypothetical protein
LYSRVAEVTVTALAGNGDSQRDRAKKAPKMNEGIFRFTRNLTQKNGFERPGGELALGVLGREADEVDA